MLIVYYNCVSDGVTVGALSDLRQHDHIYMWERQKNYSNLMAFTGEILVII
jgi:hypothetical protein